jgi:hypothetical protein
MDALVHRFGTDGAKAWYQSPCPLVGASIGQHVRHSMDHMELAILVAATKAGQDLHYDLRVRGGTLEYDMEEAKKRIVNLVTMVETVTSDDGPIKAHFMLSGDSGEEAALESTLSRELGFVAHHAIHHMAMIKIIAMHHVGLDGSDLPSDFGRAPSTVHHTTTTTRQ